MDFIEYEINPCLNYGAYARNYRNLYAIWTNCPKIDKCCQKNKDFE